MFPTNVVEKIKTHILCSVFFLNSAVYEIMWKNIAEPEMSQLTIRRMRIACWIPQATKTHSEFVILIVHCYDDCTHAAHCYIIRALSVCLSCYFCYSFNYVME
jgi:hypothetical protein